MFIGHTVFFTKREALLFIETLMIAMMDTTSSQFVIKFAHALHSMICRTSHLSTGDFTLATNVIEKMRMSYPVVLKFMSLKSKPGLYYRRRYDRTGIDIIDQQGMAEWMNHIDDNFPDIANRVWGGHFDAMFDKMVEADVNPKTINELAHYMKLRRVYTRPTEPTKVAIIRHDRTSSYLPSKPQLRLVVDNDRAITSHR